MTVIIAQDVVCCAT